MHSSALCHIETSHVRSVCQAVGTDGFSAVGGEAGHAVHDTTSLRLDPMCHRPCRVTLSASCSSPLETAVFLDSVCMGTISSRKVVTTDASLSGWGSVFEGRAVNGFWSTHLRISLPHKLFGAISSVSNAKTFSAVSPGASRAGEDRQYDHSSLYQLSGRSALPTVVHSGTQTDIVERCSSPVRESDACPRDSEFGCRALVQRKSPLHRVEAAPSCSESDLDRIQSCGSGPV